MADPPYDYSSLEGYDDPYAGLADLYNDDSYGGYGGYSGNLSMGTRNPMYMSMSSTIDPDYTEEERKRLMELARSPSPGAEMYKEYFSRRPIERDPQYKPKWWEALLGALAQFGGPIAAKTGQEAMHHKFNEAYGDWAAEGKVLPTIARGAEAQRKAEIQAEEFGIKGKAIHRRQEEIERKNKAAEQARADAAYIKSIKDAIEKKEKEAKEAKKEAIQNKKEARAEATASRAADAATRAAASGERAEETARRNKLESSYELRQARYKEREKEIRQEVEDAFISHPANAGSFTINENTGRVVFSAEARAFINKKIKQRLGDEPSMIELDPHDVPEGPKLPPIPKRPEETRNPWE